MPNMVSFYNEEYTYLSVSVFHYVEPCLSGRVF